MHELYHYGVKEKSGRYKWGSGDRPYQRLSEQQIDRYSAARLRRKFKKQIRDKRSEENGGSGRWMTQNPIGENSRKVRDEHARNTKAFENTPEYKQWSKEVDKFEKEFDKTAFLNSNLEELDKKWNEIVSRRPKENFNTLKFAVIYSPEGKKYTNDFIKRGGKDLSVAYLLDLGYDRSAAEKIVKKLIDSNLTLGDV